MSVLANAVSVGTTPTLICSGVGWALLQNLGSGAVTVGGPGITTSTGIQLPATMTSPISLRLYGESDGEGDALYGVVASSTSSVAFLLLAFAM
jgi:hypothetical protein